jgi:hypothetical protein
LWHEVSPEQVKARDINRTQIVEKLSTKNKDESMDQQPTDKTKDQLRDKSVQQEPTGSTIYFQFISVINLYMFRAASLLETCTG